MRGFLFRSTWSLVDQLAGLTSLALLVAWFAFPGIGVLEGRLYPVVNPMVPSDYRRVPPPEFRYLWTAEAHKNRACDYLGLVWHLGERGGPHSPVLAEFLDPPAINKPGTLVWNKLAINLDPQQVLEYSFAEVHHACPLIEWGDWRIMRPWVTVTPFYDAQFALDPVGRIIPALDTEADPG